MPWKYKQSSGRLSLNAKIIGTGYSGKGDGKNNPKMESVSNVGPIPQGRYKIRKARLHPTSNYDADTHWAQCAEKNTFSYSRR